MPEPEIENSVENPVDTEPVVSPEARELEAVLADREQLQGQLVRALADFQNFRKRTQAEKAQAESMILANFARELLPILDNFERTLAAAEAGADAEALAAGIAAVDRQLRSALESKGLERISTVGEPFDPEIHDAIGTEFTDDYDPDTVALEVESGYRMGDRVIRAAKVKVALPS